MSEMHYSLEKNCMQVPKMVTPSPPPPDKKNNGPSLSSAVFTGQKTFSIAYTNCFCRCTKNYVYILVCKLELTALPYNPSVEENILNVRQFVQTGIVSSMTSFAKFGTCLEIADSLYIAILRFPAGASECKC